MIRKSPVAAPSPSFSLGEEVFSDVWSILMPLGFFGVLPHKTLGQAGERRQRNIDYKGHCAFCLSSFPCRLAYCTVLCAHTHAWLAVTVVPEPCRGKVAASTGRHRWGISWVLRIQTGWKEAKLGVLEKSKTAVFIYICNMKSWNGNNAAEENMCTLHRLCQCRDVETSLCQVAAVVVGRGSEGHAGCQLNDSYVFTREIKQLVLERNQCIQQYWDVESWASFVVSYFYMLGVFEMPQCNDGRSERNPSVCSSSRRRDSSSPGHMPIAWVQSWQSSTPTTPRADVPSCAIAAVLVVAAGLVCCRPTIGQRGIQCGGTGGAGATLKPDSFTVLWILSLMNFKVSDESNKTQVLESVSDII